MMVPEAEEAPYLTRSPPPVRLMCRSADKACQVAMLVEWSDELGEQHQWSSWDDALCGFYKARKLLPASSHDIRISFEARPPKRRLRRVDRRCKCAWDKSQAEEVMWLRRGGSRCNIDASFEIRGGVVLGAHVARAWNALNGGDPEEWEHWPGFKSDEEFQYPRTLNAADAAWPPLAADEAQSMVLQVEGAMARLRAAAGALREVREQTRAMLQEQDAQLTKQWVGVNSTRTIAAGMAVASVATVATGGIAVVVLGAGSMAVGVGALASDSAGDKLHGSRFSRMVQADLYEQLGFESVEAELRTALRSAAPARRRARRLTARSPMFALGAQGAELVMATIGVRMGVRVSASMSYVGQGFSLAGRVLGGVGAGIAVGVAIHGWSTSKPNQKMVREKLAEVERSIEYLTSVEQQAEGVLCCAMCHEPLHFTAFAGQLRRCEYFHCFHRECLRGRVEVHPQRGTLCPECPRDLPGGYLGEMDSPGDRLRALLWRSGLREQVSLNMESLAPTVLPHARDLLFRLRSADDLAQSPRRGPTDCDVAQSPPRHRRGACAEDSAETYEAWQEAAEAAGSITELAGAPFRVDAEPESLAVLEALLVAGTGVPIKYRLVCWPLWLAVPERISRAEELGCSYRYLLTGDAPLPEHVVFCIDADVPRTRDDLPEVQKGALRSILLALARLYPDLGYAQGLNHLGGVFLKLGFDEETTFWMLAAVLEDMIPGCHAVGLAGLYRDTAVADVLLETFLPGYMPALRACDCDLLWICTDYFLTVGTKDMSFAVVLRLWDFCFLHGPRALFAGLLAHLELCFPTLAAEDPDRNNFEAVMEAFAATSQAMNPETFAARLQSFLHYRQGGISEELIVALRDTLSDGTCVASTEESVSPGAAAASSPARSSTTGGASPSRSVQEASALEFEPEPRRPTVSCGTADVAAVGPTSSRDRFLMPPG